MTNRTLNRILDTALVVAPSLYLTTDVLYSATDWSDGRVAVFNLLAAIAYGLAVVRLVLVADGTLQTVMAMTAAIGVPASYGVAVNTLHTHYGHADLFDLDGPANAFKLLGFFFPLTLLLGAVAVRRVAPFWVTVALAAGAAAFPPAHVANNALLAIIDGSVILVALVGVWRSTRPTTPPTEAPTVVHAPTTAR